ncbi:unnamed protein product [Scytosiphon promiscuus]
MASTAADSSFVVGSGLELSQRIIEEHRRQDEKRRVKRAANRKSASTSRARKKAYVDEMTAKNERMKQHALVLSMLPDLVLAVCRTGEMTYVSPACQWLLLHSPEDMTGANIFELVAPECHPLLRKIISENLSRPVKTVGGGVPGGRAFPSSTSQMKEDADGDETEPSDEDEPRYRDKMGNHRERLHQRYRQSQEAGGCSNSGGSSSSSSSSGGGGGGRSRGSGSAPPSSSQAPETKMLRIFRGDKTTVWCEIRLSVRNEKGDDGGSTAGAAPVPLEIILTLRTVAEGCKTAVAHEFAGGELSVAGVEADDDGYQCEVDAEEDSNSNNSGSGNDSGTRRRKATGNASHSPDSDGVKGSSGGGGGKPRAAISRALETITKAEAAAAEADPTVGREERSLSKKRQRVSIGDGAEGMDGATATAAAAAAEKSGGDNSSTAGDTGGSTTQEGSGSCSNEVDGDSNGEGEGSNNGSASKWGDGDGGGGVSAGVRRSSYRNSCDGGSGSGSDDGDGDAASEGTSAEGTDFGDDVQTAVQSLILMGGDLNKAGE